MYPQVSRRWSSETEEATGAAVLGSLSPSALGGGNSETRARRVGCSAISRAGKSELGMKRRRLRRAASGTSSVRACVARFAHSLSKFAASTTACPELPVQLAKTLKLSQFFFHPATVSLIEPLNARRLPAASSMMPD